MKSIFSVVIALLISVSSFATPDFELTTYGNHLMLKTTDWSIANVDILITDAAGNVLLNQTYSNRGKVNNLKLNIVGLPEGQYEIQISNWQKIQKQGFTKADNAVKLHETIATIFKPQVKVENNKAYINFLNQNQNATIKILDPNNQIIYSAQLDELQYAKTFNFSEALAGEYTVSISAAGQEFWNIVRVK